jgi:hypothetical protein
MCLPDRFFLGGPLVSGRLLPSDGVRTPVTALPGDGLSDALLSASLIAYLGTPGRLRRQTAEQDLGDVAGPESAAVLPLVEPMLRRRVLGPTAVLRWRPERRR